MASPLARQVPAVWPLTTTMEVTRFLRPRAWEQRLCLARRSATRSFRILLWLFLFQTRPEKNNSSGGSRTGIIHAVPPPQLCSSFKAPSFFFARAISIFTLLLQSLRSPETKRSCCKTFCDAWGFFFVVVVVVVVVVTKSGLEKETFSILQGCKPGLPMPHLWHWCEKDFLRSLWFSHPVCVYAARKLALAEITQQCRHNKTEWPKRAVGHFLTSVAAEEEQAGSSVGSHLLGGKGSETVINIRPNVT